MNYDTPEKVMQRVEEHNQVAIDMGYEVVGTFLQGSFNYGDKMSDNESDIDTKCIVIPRFSDFCLNKKPVSTTHVLPNDEHIDLKDLRLYIECFKKQNVNFVEILFTKYMVLNPKYEDIFKLLIYCRESIGRYNNYAALNCMAGMAMEKEKALCHPYPSKEKIIAEYGADFKQLSHIVRLNEFMDRWLAGEPYEDCLISKQPERLLDLKRQRNITLEEGKNLAATLSKRMYDIKTNYMANHELLIDRAMDELFDYVVVEIFKRNFQMEINQ